MQQTFRAHDLLWLTSTGHLQGNLPAWVASQWQASYPLVVRRDSDAGGRVPVGVRGLRRDQRGAAWVEPSAVHSRMAPEQLSRNEILLRSPFVSLPPVQAAIQLAAQSWSWPWGITGSVGYALATDMPVMHADSDLDLLIRCDRAVADEELNRWRRLSQRLQCRVDTQVETPYGAFALEEWLRDGRVMLKTNRGPRLTITPWEEPT